MMGARFLASFALFGLTASLAAAQDSPSGAWTTAGPAGANVTTLAVDPTNALRLFAGTELGLFRTDDGGATWTADLFAPSGILTLALDPNGTRIWAGTSAGVFESMDGGASFTSGHSMSAISSIRAIAVDPTNPSIVYAGGDGPAIARSADGGAHWTETTTPTRLVRQISQLVIDPGNTDHLLAAVETADFFYPDFVGPQILESTDAGKNWWIPMEQPGGFGPYTFAFDPRENDTVYAGTGDQVYRSVDGGVTWQTTPFVSFSSQITSLVADPRHVGTLYAGTGQGVFRSIDRGIHWELLPGPNDFSVNALAFDSDRGVLHAATTSGVWEYAVAAPTSPGPCRERSDSLCLLGGRFSVRVDAWDPRTGTPTSGTAVPQTDGFGYFSFPDFTRDASLPEVTVKMVDAASTPWRSDWVFWGSLTDAPFLLTVTDTTSGRTNTYANDPANPFCGGADITGFPSGGTGGSAARARREPFEASGGTLSLLGGRLEVELTASDPKTGALISGAAIPRGDRFGYFSLPSLTGDPGLPEVFVKAIDATTDSGTFWFFYSGMTSVPYTLTVRDTVTGDTVGLTADNFCGDADTSTFSAGRE